MCYNLSVYLTLFIGSSPHSLALSYRILRHQHVFDERGRTPKTLRSAYRPQKKYMKLCITFLSPTFFSVFFFNIYR